ncbi:class I SAM-dependent DNA methyltransferase [Microcoleus asticus]|uniref:dTDP-3-amino-3,4, 6-trideoxy-alpha-D-glucopyranose n=1 Tax=Microcoleus asticus IPMA8 TaxID=2563858 RepID=A0ABX2CXA3_9CYAN|nr:class I SAM-dependent methyltransferase [Microcoleus asticus]NQE34951.1 dTDP-3-amino-3,4,6-trideoxy-alpha-D-glucopyranose [Microcoleus asticus IPMA8]
MQSANSPLAENSRSLYNNWAFAYPVSKEGIELWLDFMQEHILKHLPKEAHILDIGCGKGEIVKSLIEKGYQVTGLDISEEMLRYASENVPNGKFIRDDIRFCKLPPNFDAVLSSNNVFSYILSLEDLTKAFQNVYSALGKNGWFGFDLSEGEQASDSSNLIEANEDKFFGDIADDYVWLQHSSHSPDGKSCQVKHVTFQLLNGSWQRSEVNFAQQGYSRSEVQSALEKVGFEKVTIYDLTKDFPINVVEDSRIIYVFRKP